MTTSPPPETESLLTLLTETLPAPILVLDERGEGVFCNRAFTDVFGTSPDEVARKSFAAIFSDAVYQQRALEPVNDPGPLTETLLSVPQQGAAPRVFFIRGHTIGLEADRPGSLLTFEDITARVGLEKDLAAATDQYVGLYNGLRRDQADIVRAAKLSALGQMAAGFAHELNNPAAVASTEFANLERYLEEILRAVKIPDAPDGDRVAEVLKELPEVCEGIRGAHSRIRGLVREFLRVSGQAVERMTPPNLNAIIENACGLVPPDLRDEADLALDLEPGLPRVVGDEYNLTQVAYNLVLNAYQACAARSETDPAHEGVVSVTTAYLSKSDMVELRIADTGPGLTEEARDHLFEPFYTTRPVGRGRGLGLFEAYNVVTTFGGSIRCESAPWTGAEFIVTLPVDKHAATPTH